MGKEPGSFLPFLWYHAFTCGGKAYFSFDVPTALPATIIGHLYNIGNVVLRLMICGEAAWNSYHEHKPSI